jgi:hypothetical protein
MVPRPTRTWVSVRADDDSTCCSPKANPSSFSNSAMFSSVYPLLPLSEDLGREWSADSTNVL